MEISSKYIPELPILNIKHLVGENTFEGIVTGHIEAKSFDLYQNGQSLNYGLIIFPQDNTKNLHGSTGDETVNTGDSIFSIYCSSITSDTSRPQSPDKAMVPIKVIKGNLP